MKSNPISVRLDLDDLELAQTISGIEKPQKLVDFLLSEYTRPHKDIVGFGVKISQVSSVPLVNNIKKQLKMAIEQSAYEIYLFEINNAKTVKEIEQTVKELKIDKALAPPEKHKLEAIAIEKSKTFEF